MILATISTPFTYITGVIEWKEKYRRANVKIFINKYRYGLIVLVLGIVCTVWYACDPDILIYNSGLRVLFFICHFAILTLITYLGYLGGKLVYRGAH
jgi:hypothetical protein